MTDTVVPTGLIGAYRGTDYRVFHPDGHFSLRVGQYSPEAAKLLAQGCWTNAVFITADNPFSEMLSEAENQQRRRELLSCLKAVSPLVFEGEGRGEDPVWPPERSFFALGIDHKRACRIGEQFGQNAIVELGPDAIPQLILLR